MVYHNPIRLENLTQNRDGLNVTFYLQYQNIVSGLINSVQYGPWCTYGTNKRSLSGGTVPFTLDAVNGIVTMGSPPDAGITQPFFFDYYFQWFVDADYQDWIDQATLELGMTLGNFVGQTPGSGDLTAALIQLVVERYWINRASLYANKYATSGGGAAEQIQTVTQNFLNLAKQARAKADRMRIAAYVDPGERQMPASAVITTQPAQYTPPR